MGRPGPPHRCVRVCPRARRVRLRRLPPAVRADRGAGDDPDGALGRQPDRGLRVAAADPRGRHCGWVHGRLVGACLDLALHRPAAGDRDSDVRGRHDVLPPRPSRGWPARTAGARGHAIRASRA